MELLKEQLKKLSEPFPEEKILNRDYDHIPYIKVEDYRDRLNEVIGLENYNETYEESQVVTIKKTFCMSVKCRLSFLDESGKVVLIKESYGGSNINFPKQDSVELDTTASIPNDIASACQDAFKRICKNQLLMGKTQLDDITKKKAPAPYMLKVLSQNDWNGNLFSDIMDLETGEKLKLAVFKNQVSEYKKVYPTFVKDMEISIIGKLGKDKQDNDQIIFSKINTTPKKKTISKTAPANDSIVSLRLWNISFPVPREKNPANYSMQSLDSEKKTYNLVFEQSVIQSFPRWGEFVERCKKNVPVAFNVEGCIKNENGREIVLIKKFL